MKKLFSILLIGLFTFGMAQDSKDAKETANRFFYELTFKPKKDSAKTEKVLTALDIVKDRSVYRDYTVIGQDSIIKIQVEAMQKSGVFKDMSKSIRMPKFSEKIVKLYPGMKIQYIERISSGFTPMSIAYNETPKFDWKILNEKKRSVLTTPRRLQQNLEEESGPHGSVQTFRSRMVLTNSQGFRV